MALSIKVENVSKKYRIGTINRNILFNSCIATPTATA
jgi:hypothetical protein